MGVEEEDWDKVWETSSVKLHCVVEGKVREDC